MSVAAPFNWEGLSVAPSDTILTPEPTWTRLDNAGGGLRVAEIEIRRGRQDEFERTDTGTMRVSFNDRDGSVDPTSVTWTSRPIAFAVRNPVTDTWHPRFRGVVDDHRYDLHPSRVKGSVVIEAVDALDFFSNVEMAPGLFGDTPPAVSEGYVWFEDTDPGSGSGPQTRINQGLGNVSWPTELSSIFTGNVVLQETAYSPGESLLTVFHDAADAEFPGVANFLVDKYGAVCFRGRFARFDPATVAASATHWDYNTWTVGIDSGAQIRPPLIVNKSRRFIRNAGMCYPQGITRADRENQVYTDATSIAAHGVRSWSAENLILSEGFTSGLSGDLEALSYAETIVENYKNPVARIERVTVRALRPDDPRASATWAFMCGVDISDTVTVNIDFPGGGGIATTYHVEGITEVHRPLVKDLDTGYPFSEVTVDLSPSTFFTYTPTEWEPA